MALLVEAPVPAPEWTLLHDTTLGAWCVFLALAPVASTDWARARELALAWRGDRFTVYANTTSAVPDTALVWELLFADAASAAAVEQLVSSLVPPHGLLRVDARLVLAESNSGTPLDWALPE